MSGPVTGVRGELADEVAPTHGRTNPTVVSTKDCSFQVQTPGFLELCVNTGEFHVTLGEIELSNIMCDESLFSAIKLTYLQRRGFRTKFFLLKPVAVNFVRVSRNILS